MTESPIATFTLPVPPSTNALFTTRRGTKQRIKTDAYRAWIREAGYSINLLVGALNSQSPLIKGPIKVALDLPLNRQRDLDNTIKPTLDILVRHGLIEDDRWVDELQVRRVPVTEPLVVSIWRLDAAKEKSGVVRQSFAVREVA